MEDYVKVKKIQGLVVKARLEAINALKVFFTHLGINPYAFTHIFSVNMAVRNLNKKDTPDMEQACATFEPETFTIILDKDTLLDMLDRYEKGEEKEETVILNIAATVVHEMLHANRSIMINNVVNRLNLQKNLSRDVAIKKQKFSDYDMDKYESTLEMVYKEGHINDFKYFIPINIKLEPDGIITAVAYNKATGNFQVFKNYDKYLKIVKILDYKNHKDLYNIVGNHINNGLFSTIRTLQSTKGDLGTEVTVASDYYTDLHGKNLKEAKTELEYESALIKDYNAAVTRIGDSRALEEAITEALANIIMYSRNSDTLDLNHYCDKFTSVEDREENKIGALLIKLCGPELLKWFVTSVYDETYEDYMKNLFKENYYTFIGLLNTIYMTEDSKDVKNEIEHAIYLINEAMKGKKL